MKSSRLVYSTDSGKLCPDCQQPIDECRCGMDQEVKGSGLVTLHYETKGRKGKGATLIKELALTPDELKKLAKELKANCATGGAIKEGVIEIQGDHRAKILALLLEKGIKAKKSGG